MIQIEPEKIEWILFSSQQIGDHFQMEIIVATSKKTLVE